MTSEKKNILVMLFLIGLSVLTVTGCSNDPKSWWNQDGYDRQYPHTYNAQGVEVVYVTTEGKWTHLYHKKGCFLMKATPIVEMTIDQAKEVGKIHCGNCFGGYGDDQDNQQDQEGSEDWSRD